MSEAESGKILAGRRAAELVEDGMRVGLGTGSTVRHTILALGERRPKIVCAATSERTRTLATQLGLDLRPPDELVALDLAIDGADEVDRRLHLVKGGGGAHTREKIVAAMAARFVVVVDDAKLVEHLGAFGLPLEVLPFAPRVATDRVRALGAHEVRPRAQPSDNGLLLYDAYFPPIDDPAALAMELASVPGLVEHGLFPGEWVERVIVGGAGGVRELTHDATTSRGPDPG